MADYFLKKSSIDLDQCLEHGGGLAIEAYPALHGLLSSKASAETAQLFAEPLVSRGNDTASPSVSWYTDFEGDGQPVTRLSDDAQASISARISRQLGMVRDLIDDPDDGPLISAALHLTSPDDLLSVGGRPVIINWGMLPKGMERDEESRKTHYDRTLGRFLPLGAAPPLTEDERQALTSSARAAAVVAPQETAERTAGSGIAATVGGAVGAAASGQGRPESEKVGDEAASILPVGNGRLPVVAWLPLVLLLLLGGLALVWLLIPGSRIFPFLGQGRAVTDEAALSAAVGVNRALEERLAVLQAALDAATCEDDGTLLMPDGRTIEGLLPPDPSDPGDVPGAVREAGPRSMLPPDPQRVRVSAGQVPLDTVSLLEHIEERTVMVLVPSDDGLSGGTGFFVGPDLVITNQHVVADGSSDAIFITNEAIGSIRPAEALKILGPLGSTGTDLALLRVAGVDQPAFEVVRSDTSLRLQSVIAAGYPGDLLRTDDQFQLLLSGNIQAVPELVVTDGTISAEQSLGGLTNVVVHSAPISTGNSGGPLVDMCGRLIGVNTFVAQGALRNLNFAIAAEDLMNFVADTEVLPRVVTQPCSPRLERPSVPSAHAPDPEAQESSLLPTDR